MRYFAINQIPFPRRLSRPGEIGTLHWGAVNHSPSGSRSPTAGNRPAAPSHRITAILHNPTYTGTYVYGRRRSLPVIEAGQITKVRTQQLPQDEWKVMIHSSHPAYISWSEYLENAAQLRRNHVSGMSEGHLGSPREGSALLQGLVICGKCGRRMSPRYYGTGGKRASYECSQRRRQDGTEGVCWTVAAAAVDAAVATHVLECITLEQLDISLAVLNELEQQAAAIEHQWQLRLERARYEADRAARQFDAVEPENRLVVRTLERRWNELLQQLAELEEAYAQARLGRRLELSQQERQQILRLAKDIPALWLSPTTTAVERKEMLGLLVKQVALTPVESPERQTRIAILWHTGATTELVAMRLTTGDKLRTSEEVVQTIRELAAHMTDVEIALELNQRGLTSGKGRAFTADSVGWSRWKFQINKPESDPRCVRALGVREDGCYSTSALAEKLGVGIHTIHKRAREGNS